MILDTSAVVAVLRRAPEAPAVVEALAAAGAVRTSAPTYVELSHVVGQLLGPPGLMELETFVRRYGVEIVPFTPRHAELARFGLRTFGRGSGSLARLNLGDSFSYALAIDSGEPLLFVGEDFARTDVMPALR